MRARPRAVHALLLGAVFVLGCENPHSAQDHSAFGLSKPPPDRGGGGGGNEDGPRVIAFSQSSKGKGYCIRTMADDGSNVATVLCPESSGLWEPSWEPGGSAIAYRTISGDVFRVDIAPDGSGTNNALLLTSEDCGGCKSPKWSPLGDEIAVLGEATVLVIPPTGCPFPDGRACPEVLYEQPLGSTFYGLAWSPDGTQLALTDSRGPCCSNPRFIVVLDRTTGSVEDSLEFAGSTIDWGVGSRATTLAITVTPPGVTGAAPRDIYVFDMSTPSVPPQLVVQNGRHPTFSPDGVFIAYQETIGKRYPLVKYELDTGVKTELQRTGLWTDWR